MDERGFSAVEYNEQARRLRAFLAQGGTDIKHTTALEAVARMHGAKDWPTLKAASEAIKTDASGTGVKPCEYVVVNRTYSGLSTVVQCETKDAALRAFICEARQLVDLLPVGEGSEAAEVIFFGQDLDLGLPLLALRVNGEIAVTLQMAGVIELSQVEKDKGGKSRLVHAKPVDLFGLEKEESFFEVGRCLTTAFAHRPLQASTKSKGAAKLTMVGHLIVHDFNQVLGELSVRSFLTYAPKALEIDPRRLWTAIEKVRVMVLAKARITGAEDRVDDDAQPEKPTEGDGRVL